MKTIEITLPTSIQDVRFIAAIRRYVLTILRGTLTSASGIKEKIKSTVSQMNFLSRRKSYISSEDKVATKGSSFSEKFSGFKYRNKNFVKYAVIAIVVLGVSYVLLNNVRVNSGGSADPRVDVSDAKAVIELNKVLEFPLVDEEGEEISRIKYEILNAELRDEIIVGGKRANSVKGRTFLILNLKVTNEHNQTIEINTRDYLRLSVNGSDEQLAPDIHNDPVSVQAISTKFTRLGMPINDTDTNLILRVGEIEGEKEEIPLNF